MQPVCFYSICNLGRNKNGCSAGSAAIFEPSRHLQGAGGVKSHLVALYVDQQVTHSVTHQHGHEPLQPHVCGPDYNHFDLINEAISGECEVSVAHDLVRL